MYAATVSLDVTNIMIFPLCFGSISLIISSVETEIGQQLSDRVVHCFRSFFEQPLGVIVVITKLVCQCTSLTNTHLLHEACTMRTCLPIISKGCTGVASLLPILETVLHPMTSHSAHSTPSDASELFRMVHYTWRPEQCTRFCYRVKPKQVEPKVSF